MKVYQAIAAVSAEIAKVGIAKDRKNDQQGYKFRGIDEVYNALAPLLAHHGLVVLPRMLDRIVTERTTAKGGVLFYVVVTAEFDFVSAEDGSKHTVRTFGEAMDSGDKATNKAMSAAYKYAALQAFCIPTEGDNDADATTHVVVPTVPAVQAAPAGYEDWRHDFIQAADNGLKVMSAAWSGTSEEIRAHYLAAETKAFRDALRQRAARVDATEAA